MAQNSILRLNLHPGDGIPDGAGKRDWWRGVRDDGEEPDHEAAAGGGGRHGCNDDVVEGRFLETTCGG